MSSEFHHAERKGWEWGKDFWLAAAFAPFARRCGCHRDLQSERSALWREKFPAQTRARAAAWRSDGCVSARTTARQRATRFRKLKTGRCCCASVGLIPSRIRRGLLNRRREILGRHPQSILVLAGACTEEKYGKMIERKIQELGLEGRVMLTGGLAAGRPAVDRIAAAGRRCRPAFRIGDVRPGFAGGVGRRHSGHFQPDFRCNHADEGRQKRLAVRSGKTRNISSRD